MIVLLAEHALMNVLLKQYQKATSIKLILMFALTVVPVLMFALLRQFILHSITTYKKLGQGHAQVCPCLFSPGAVLSLFQDTLNISILDHFLQIS